MLLTKQLLNPNSTSISQMVLKYVISFILSLRYSESEFFEFDISKFCTHVYMYLCKTIDNEYYVISTSTLQV